MWGILTSDVVRHVADAIHQQNGVPVEHAIEQIRKVLNAELTSPTADTKGSFS
jgi:antitoxin component of RelBE/YafQ-DinJ toxin-antitoxin module